MIKPSSAREVDRLLADLQGVDATRREAAVARLRVIGSRALPKLAGLVASSAPAEARAAALKALEGVDDDRAAAVARAVVDDGDDAVVASAVAVLRGWVAQAADARVLDALMGLAMDPRRRAAVREAALEALSELPREVLGPLLPALGASKAGTASLDALAHAPAHPGAPPRGARDRGPELDTPVQAREWIASHGNAPLSDLHAVVTRIRERERQQVAARPREEWTLARGAAHAALARRSSRVALYDLRESFGAAGAPLPLDFLTAIGAVGDGDCLEPLARAWAAASPAEGWWRDRLRDAAAGIVAREKLTGRHAVVRRVRAKYAGFLR